MGRSSRSDAWWIVVVATLLLWAVMAPFHPDPDSSAGVYAALRDDIDRWLFVHCAQLVLAPFVVFAVWLLLRGLTSVAATISRVALVVWLVFFSAYDALAGIGTGVLVREANRHAGAARRSFAMAADVFWDGELTGTTSWWGVVATVAWPIVIVSAVIALRQAIANWGTILATAVAGLIALHAGFPATIGFVALVVAVVLRRRETELSPSSNWESIASVTTARHTHNCRSAYHVARWGTVRCLVRPVVAPLSARPMCHSGASGACA